MTGQFTGPSRVWYWVAGAAVVASVVWLAVGIFFGIRGFSRQVEGFQRVPIPGEAEVRFDAPGGYTVYFEGLGAADEQVALPSLSVSLVPVGGGGEVPVYPYSGSSTYSVGGRSGRAVGTFRIDAPGRFLIRTQGDLEGGPAEVAVGSSIAPTIGRTLALTIPAVLLSFFGERPWRWWLRSAGGRLAPGSRRGPPGRSRPHRRGGSPIPAGATSFATGTARGGRSGSLIMAPRGSIRYEQRRSGR